MVPGVWYAATTHEVMRKIMLASTALSCSVALLAAPAPHAGAAPSGPSNVGDIINTLQSQGYKVIVNKTGSAPLERCTLRAVRPGRNITEYRKDVRERTVERVVAKTIYVDVSC